MKIRTLLTCVAIASTASIAGAAVVVYEGFTDYTDPLGVQTGGTGWSGAWAASPTSSGTVTGSSTATIATTNLAAASDYVFDSGSTSGTDTDGSYVSDVGGGMARTFTGNAFDLNTNATTYFSYNWLESGSGSGGNLTVAFSDNSSFSRRIWQMTTASSSLSLKVDNNGTSLGSIGFTANTAYTLVGKVVSTAAGADTVSISIFQNGTAIGSEPVTWGISGNVAAADQGVSVGRLFLQGSGNLDQFDEFRIGESFADVTGVPEPSTYALMLGFAAFGFILWRRRQ